MQVAKIDQVIQDSDTKWRVYSFSEKTDEKDAKREQNGQFYLEGELSDITNMLAKNEAIGRAKRKETDDQSIKQGKKFGSDNNQENSPSFSLQNLSI